MNSDIYTVHTYQSSKNAAQSLTDQLLKQTKRTIQTKNKCVWAVSGGGSILKIYDSLYNRKEEFLELEENIIVLWVDERHVPHSNQHSNFGTAISYFWNNFERAELIPVPYYKDLQQSIDQYKQKFMDFKIDVGGIDITILGMGEDGHTASLFPNSEALRERQKLVTGIENSNLKHNRTTLTYPLINSSNHIFLFFYGKKKEETWTKALQSGDKNRYPILGISPENLEVYRS